MRDLNKLLSGLGGRGILAACVASVAILGLAGGAEAGDGWKKKGRGYYAPGYYGPGYVKVPPGHVRYYYAPAPVYYAPRPVVVYPAPMMYAPAYPAYGPPGVTINLPLR
ncbi:MAG: hypothetical protein Q8M19_28640 [Reyranella sp.]|nr:hypothetical protein [Reyranella sp.]